jgi:glycosyltransferase involved in cell wall biosynthesis
MRVLNVNHLLDPVTGGGTAERTFQLCRALVPAGVECAILTLDIGVNARRREELNGVRIVALPCIWRRFFVPKISWRLLKHEVEAADIVHIMGHWTLLNALVFLAARKVRRPYVVCPAGALPVIGRSALLKRLYNHIVGRRIIRYASGHVAITRDEIAHLSEYGVNPEAIAVIPNGVPASPDGPVECADFLARLALGGRRFVLFLGRLAYIKGPDLLLEAFADLADRLPDLDLVYAGPDGGMLAELRQYAARRGVEARVHFTGYLGGGDKVCALRSCELLAVPSRREAMSIVALEAGACGKPVLLTDRCGFCEIERVGGGRVVGAASTEIAGALLDMTVNPDELAAMGARLKAFVMREYTWEQSARRYRALFEQIAGERASGESEIHSTNS